MVDNNEEKGEGEGENAKATRRARGYTRGQMGIVSRRGQLVLVCSMSVRPRTDEQLLASCVTWGTRAVVRAREEVDKSSAACVCAFAHTEKNRVKISVLKEKLVTHKRHNVEHDWVDWVQELFWLGTKGIRALEACMIVACRPGYVELPEE